MELGIFFYVICALWAMTVVANLIQATRICYAIEARSGRPMLRNGLPGFANVIPVAFNIGVAQDEETQDLRWQMNKRLILILGGFAVFFFFLRVAGPTAG
jgi:hypothetical protein